MLVRWITLPNMSESTQRHSTDLPDQPSEGVMLSASAEEPMENGEDSEDLSEMESYELYLKDRRRAKSLPAYPDQATLFEDIANHGRKRVKFADSMGLDLASVKHFSTAEDPMIPSKVLSRLQSFPPKERDLLGDLCLNFKSALTLDRFVATFKMPAEAEDFEATVMRRHVTLEKITITQFDVRGHIRTNTHSNSKRDVGVRYTFNNWLSFVDAQAIAVPGEQTGMVGERFTFMMYTPPFLDPSSSVHFAVYLRNDQGEFWDNNDGQNYTLKCNGIPTYDSPAFHAT